MQLATSYPNNSWEKVLWNVSTVKKVSFINLAYSIMSNKLTKSVTILSAHQQMDVPTAFLKKTVLLSFNTDKKVFEKIQGWWCQKSTWKCDIFSTSSEAKVWFLHQAYSILSEILAKIQNSNRQSTIEKTFCYKTSLKVYLWINSVKMFVIRA